MFKEASENAFILRNEKENKLLNYDITQNTLLK